MTYFYSASTRGFYIDSVNGEDIPGDCVEIPADQYASLFAAQAAGREIRPDDDGTPIAVERPQATGSQLAEMARTKRDQLLRVCDWTTLPDVPMDSATSAAWKTYRQALRDITGQATFPQSVTWPVAPA